MYIFANKVHLGKGWAENVRISISGGYISEIDLGVVPMKEDVRVDTLLPALSNLHSHSFQRAMAGMTEYRAKDRESFWTWRELMYRFLEQLSPEDVSAIAALTFMEMQKAGYASVGEFHYLHHGPDGEAYKNPAELSLNIMEATKLTGIGLTHLPVLYTYSNTAKKPLSNGQLRFGNSLEAFADIVSTVKNALHTLPHDTCLGVAAHSLRAVSPRCLEDLVSAYPDGPVHMHISEQIKEIEEIKSAYGARPVEWLLEKYEVNSKWCLIHATHMTKMETQALAKTGAIAGLCPITEANLGDGIFNGQTFIEAGGTFGVGSDSNINISLTEELRTLEYSQRLLHKERNLMLNAEGSTGEALFLGAAKGGAKALGRHSGSIEIGKLADLLALDSTAPSLCALSNEQLFDGLVFASKDAVVTDLWSAGRHQVRNRHHVAEDEIIKKYQKMVTDLKDRLG